MTRPSPPQEAAEAIRQALARVTALREARVQEPRLGQAVTEIKQLQTRRFAGTYADLRAGPPYQEATNFFLQELYGDRDYAERDAQFARIAAPLQKLFPEQVVATATALAELHALTEELDHAMGQAWYTAPSPGATAAARYLQAWRTVGNREGRATQLEGVLGIGREMARLTRLPGLRLLLKMMRGPASAAGMASLQHFLETGFDTFAAMSKRQRNAHEEFLSLVQERESAWISRLFDEDVVACETALLQVLGQAR